MNWTYEQQQAIDIRDKSMIVSASAGSGKTAVLIERLLQILSDMERHIRADEMIVVTFTNDAAAEMKQRLTKALSEKLDAMSRNQHQQDELYSWLLQQRSLLGNAKISTIHAFCFDLIRENAEECGVSSQFKIAESGQDAIYRRRAIQTVLEQFSKKQPEQAELLFGCFCTRNDKKLEQIITGIDKYLNSLAFPDYWLTKAEQLCKEENTDLLDAMRKAFCNRIANAIKIAGEGREIAQTAAVSPNGKYPYEEQVLEPEISMMQNQMQYVRTADKETLLENPEMHSVDFIDLRRVKTAGCQKDKPQYEVLKDIRNLYKDIYQNACKNLLAPLKFYAEDEKIQNQVIPLLLDLTKQYREELFQEKKRQNVLGFDDAEYLVLTKLLGQVDEQGQIHKTELARALSEQYQLIMVDEYQDSNNRQDCLFRLLARGNSESLNYGDNIFLVGDVKQSIYRFRNANPENFMSAIDKSHSEPTMQTVYLNQNFRSSRGVVDFVNALFTSMMTEQCGEVAYSEHEKLNFGAKIYDNLAENHQRTRILFAQSSDHDKEEKTKSFVMQAECIADTIMQMIVEQAPVMTKDGIRPCEYKDFCILMRTKTNHSILAESFQKRNIPVLCQESHQFLALPEIRLIWNLLRIADNPMTDMAMASVLLSPLYGFSAEELAVLKFLATDKKRLYLQVRYLTEQKTDPAYAVLAEKCSVFLRQLEQIRKLTDRLPLETCIQEIYEITDLLSLQSLYENADERRENLEIFSQYAQNYREHADLSAQSCLSGWLRYLDHFAESEEEDDFAPKNAIHANTNFVSVKTIHKSKGLEYPFVFVANLDRSFSKGHSKNGTDSILAEKSGLLGLRMLDQKQYLKVKTVAFTYLDLIRKQKEKHEEMRLLYVALTRAKQQLFLVFDESAAKCKNTNLCENYPEIVKTFAGEAKSMQDWILWFLFSSGQGDYIRDACSGISSSSSGFADYVVWTPESQIQDKLEQEIVPKVKPDAAVISVIQNQLAYAYDSGQTILPSKYSVTELSHEADEIQIREPEFLRQEEKAKKLHGNARGTAIHKIMQYIDFQKAQQDLLAELERIQNKGYLTSLEIQALKPEKLKKFFNSSLYQRIAVSDQVQKEKQIFVRIADLALPETSELLQNYTGTDGIIIGTMDLLFHEPDGWVIVDYKTDHSQEKEELLQKYSKQLGLYQKAAELILGESVKQAYIYYFTKDQTIEVDLSQIMY